MIFNTTGSRILIELRDSSKTWEPSTPFVDNSYVSTRLRFPDASRSRKRKENFFSFEFRTVRDREVNTEER